MKKTIFISMLLLLIFFPAFAEDTPVIVSPIKKVSTEIIYAAGGFKNLIQILSLLVATGFIFIIWKISKSPSPKSRKAVLIGVCILISGAGVVFAFSGPEGCYIANPELVTKISP